MFRRRIKEMTTELTKEQIEGKIVDLGKLDNSIELAKLQIKQFEKSIKDEMPLKEAKVDLDNFKKELERQEHNAVVFRKQIKTGKFETA